MQKLNKYNFLVLSLFLHILLAGTAIFLYSKKPIREQSKVTYFEILPTTTKTKSFGKTRGQSGASLDAMGRKIDLRPSAMRSGGLSTADSQGGNGSNSLSAFTQQQLRADSKSLIAFDLLAAKIDSHLEYSDLLVENGVEGAASLELYFDSNGDVDENKSYFGGDDILIRGAFARAVRSGLVQWYVFDAHRLNKDQFRNQHFSLQFSLSAVFGEDSKLAKSSPNSYSFLRRRVKDYCLRPFNGAPSLDVSCVALKAYGAVANSISRKRRIMFDNLKDELELYNRRGLSGISAAIEQAKSRSS